MQSNNFSPLKAQWPQLYEYASFAERYVHSDPHTAIVKLRCFAEILVGILYRELQLPSEPTDSFFDRLNSKSYQAVVEEAVVHKLHAIRMLGNKAAHGRAISSQEALLLLKEAYLVGQWLHKTLRADDGEATAYPDFVPPIDPDRQAEEWLRSAETLAVQLAEAKAELAGLEQSEKTALADISALHQTLDELRLESFKRSSLKAASSIDFELEKTRQLLSLQDAFAEYALNGGQAELVKRLDAFLSGRGDSVFLLKGYAGTGKTFITKGVTEYFRAIGRNYVLAAPTGKASKVIAKKTGSPAYTVHKTIYSFKDIKEYREDDVDGSETYKFYAQLNVNEMSADTVFIVDEASMFADTYQEAEFFRFGSGYLLRDFFKFVNLDHNDHHKKVIFIGDDAQLPPVGMNFSPALDADYLYRKHHVRSTSYELTEVVRQKADSGVMHNSLKLRASLKAGVFNQLDIDLDYPDISKVEPTDLMEAYLASCGGKINGESIVIALSNADVASFNCRIREHFFPGCPQVVPGDKVMAVSNSNAFGFFISNGDFGLIREVRGEPECRCATLKRKNPDTKQVETIEVSLRFRDVLVGFRDLDDRPRFFAAKIFEGLLYSEHPTLSSDENKALYLDFCLRHPRLPRGTLEFKQTLMVDPYFNALRLKFGYAITCHKAQGSEWNHVFVKCKTHQSQLSADYFRWFYTAITRTASTLYLLDPPALKLGSGIKIVNAPIPRLSQLEAGSATASPIGQAVEPDSETFGIPPSELFLLAVLSNVQALLAGSGVEVDQIHHNQYQEAYFIKRDNEFARINIGYGSKGKVTALSAQSLTEFSAWLMHVLAPLKSQPVVINQPPSTEQVQFDKPFLNEFHQRLVGLSDGLGIGIQHVEAMNWCQRYRFVRDGELAVYDIWYNGKDQFKKCQPVVNACTPGTLVAEVGILITDGMSQ
ncbi:ATP-dependent DNA helicase [Pseudomonas veronii]|uniref:ATP-dependent DNA helicase n=1 Tax=Pseudomonas veronii TaxID=76761 RepID=UPI002D76FB76|nr:AAA family ATPase [Pseudomonas veronii]WRU61915.1 AAA family ATPase [Pseudomonas veronii]